MFDYIIIGAGYAEATMAEQTVTKFDKKVFDYLS